MSGPGADELRDRDALGRVLIGLDRAAGGDLPDDRERARLGLCALRQDVSPDARRKRGRWLQPERARLGRVSLQDTLAFERGQVVMDGRRGGETDRGRDLPDRRRVAAAVATVAAMYSMIRCLRSASCLVTRVLPGHADSTERLFDCQARGSAAAARVTRGSLLDSRLPWPSVVGFRFGLTALSFWPFLPHRVSGAALRAALPRAGARRTRAVVPQGRSSGWRRPTWCRPIDLVPDFIPFFSRMDDVAVVVIALDPSSRASRVS